MAKKIYVVNYSVILKHEVAARSYPDAVRKFKRSVAIAGFNLKTIRPMVGDMTEGYMINGVSEKK